MTDSLDESKSESAQRVYEVSFLMLPSIPEEQIPDKVSQIKSAITQNGGEVIYEEQPRLRNLAYEMIKSLGAGNERFRTAYFGWIKFESIPATAITLKSAIDKMPEVLRFIIVKTIRENTYISPESLEKIEDDKEEGVVLIEEEKVEAPDISSKLSDEAIDKSIDDLVSEK
jgi:ribosomal protein S6